MFKSRNQLPDVPRHHSGDRRFDGRNEASGGSDQKQSVVSVAGWTMCARFLSQATQFALFLVAARVLMPAEFGVFAIVQAVFAFLVIVARAGWTEFILSWRGDDRAISETIGLALLAGNLLFVVGFLSSWPAASLTNSQTIGDLVKIMSAWVVFTPVGAAYIGIIIRRGDARAAALIEIASDTIALILGAVTLLAGWGVIGLAISKFGRSLSYATLATFVAAWRHGIHFTGKYTKEIFDVSAQIFYSGAIHFVSGNAGTLLVGAFLGPAGAGFYRAAERITGAVAELVFEPFRMLIWIIFRGAVRDTHDLDEVRHVISRKSSELFPVLIAVVCPVFVGLAIVADDATSLLLGAEWAEAANIVAILAVASIVTMPTVATIPLLTLSEKIRKLPPYQIVNAAAAVVALVVLAPFGIFGAALAKVVSNIVTLGTTLFLQWRHANAHWGKVVVDAGPVYSGLAALICAVLATRIFLGDMATNAGPAWPIINLGAQVMAGGVAYLGILLLLRPGFLIRFRSF